MDDGGHVPRPTLEVPIDEAPDGVAIIGLDASRDTCSTISCDSRGVARVYAMRFDDGVWTLSRTTADFSTFDFSQRFTGTFSDDGRTIRTAGSSPMTGRPGSTTSISSTREWGNNERMTILQGQSVRLRPATLDDVPELARIRHPEVHRATGEAATTWSPP